MVQALNGVADQLAQFLSRQAGASPIEAEDSKKQEQIAEQINKGESFAQILADQIDRENGASAQNSQTPQNSGDSQQRDLPLSELAQARKQQADAYSFYADQALVANASRVSGSSDQIDQQELNNKSSTPSAANLAGLSANASEQVGQALTQYNIPSAPAKITFDNQGQIQFPEDYPYEDQFRAALENNPELARELSDINELASNYVAVSQTSSLSQALSQANSKQEEAAIIAKYSHLFNNNQPPADIALNFTRDGALSLSANDKLL